MKELDKSKVYDLSDLNTDERNKLHEHLCNFQKGLKFISVDEFNILEYKNYNEWVFYYNTRSIKYKYELTNAKELFEPQYEVTMIAEAPKEDKPIQYQIGIDAIGIAEKNMTIDECLAIARFNITKYSYRKKNQDLEDFKKVIAYANWAIKLLNKK